MGTFRSDSIIGLLFLVSLAWFIGHRVRKQHLGILIDYRGRNSLTHFQIVLWTIVILSSWLAVFASSGFDPATLTLSPELLGLMGISAGSAVFATGVKAGKGTSGSGAEVARRAASSRGELKRSPAAG